MAVAKNKKAAPKEQPKKFSLTDTQRWVIGVVLFTFALFLITAVVSYYFYWSYDQNFVRWGEMTNHTPDVVINPAGKTGAVLAHYVVGEWFGVFGIVIPVLLLVLALRVINYRPAVLRRSVRIGLILMILGSLTLGFAFGTKWGVFGSGLGGAHGIIISDFIKSYIGAIGTGLVLLLGWILLGVYINSRRTISVVTKVGKGIYEGSEKMVGAVIDHASTIGHKDEEDEYDAPNPYAEAKSAQDREDSESHEGSAGPGDAYFEQERLAPQESKEYGEDADEAYAAAYEAGTAQDGIEQFEEYERYEAEETGAQVGHANIISQGLEIVRPQDEATYAGRQDSGSEIFVIEPGNVPADATVAAQAMGSGSQVVTFGDEAGDFITTGSGHNQYYQDNKVYAGGVGAFSDEAGNLYSEENGFEGQPKQYATAEDYQQSGSYGSGITVVGPTDPDKGVMSEASNNNRNAYAGNASGGPFEVIDAPVRTGGDVEPQPSVGGGWTNADSFAGTGVALSAGGVVEAVAPGGVSPDARLEVVVASRSDVVLDDNDIDESLYDPTKELSKYQKPPVELLEDHSIDVTVTEEEIYENKNQIVRTLENFGIKIDKIKATIGPTVTLYEIVPAAGVKISKIKNLEDDIALSLKALGIRIIAPMPGKGTVGIEVPNKDKEIVSMYSVVKTMKFQESGYELPVVLGKTISNETFVIDLAKMPHLLVAGSTGQGKSVGLNAIITSLLYRKHPAELKFVLVDPKRVELSLYGKLEKHFLAKMASEEEAILTDTQKVVYTLNALCQEMTERYDLLKEAEVKKISEYNAKFLKRRLNPQKGHRFLPYIVVVIDEFADMIMTAGREVEAPITRLAQLARAVGIHLVIATQRPDVKVITGLIKANFPARIAFRVMSMVDSRTIIDQPGANQLIGRGDLLMSLNGELTRVQCAFIDTPEIERITEFIGSQRGYPTPYELPDYQPESESGPSKGTDMGQVDPMFEECARFVVQNQQGSTSSIQRRFSIGYNRAGRIMDQLEFAGIVGRAEGSKPREVLITDVASLEYILSKLDD